MRREVAVVGREEHGLTGRRVLLQPPRLLAAKRLEGVALAGMGAGLERPVCLLQKRQLERDSGAGFVREIKCELWDMLFYRFLLSDLRLPLIRQSSAYVQYTIFSFHERQYRKISAEFRHYVGTGP